MAKAISDEYIELKVHPRYKDNVARYVQVIRALPITETAPERTDRIAKLQSELLDPATSAEAAVQLEALGPDGVDTLLKGSSRRIPRCGSMRPRRWRISIAARRPSRWAKSPAISRRFASSR